MLAELFGSNVQSRRKELGLTQEKLAEIIKVEVRTISRIECGEQGTEFGTIEKLASALAISPWKLFKDEAELKENFKTSRLVFGLFTSQLILIVF